MMTAFDPWQNWIVDWQRAPTPSLQSLRHEAARKRRRMQIIVALELLTSAVGFFVIVLALLRFRKDAVTCVTLVSAGLLMGGMQWLTLYVRRTTWRSVADTPAEWLRLAIRRARIALLLIRIQIVGGVVSALLAIPLVVHVWQQDTSPEAHARLIHIVVVNIAVNAVILIPALGWAIWYAARQRRKIRDAGIMLRELKE
jgi:hypothetical protein